MTKPVHVFSEIGKLKKVCLHRPGKELENLMPDYLERLLFDDIPYLEEAQKEHDAFAKALEDNGVEVVYLEKLAAEAIDAGNVKEQFVDEWISESGIVSENVKAIVKEKLLAMDTFDMVLKTMEGFKKSEIDTKDLNSLADLIETDYPFLVDPMPNLYFTRDPFATMANGVTVNHMFADTRNRETLYGHYIFTYHPEFGGDNVEKYYSRDEDTRIEGGDELVLSKDVLAVGISQRTDSRSIEKVAKRLFEAGAFKEVLAFLIGENRKFMHLDTVFTMVDYDKFTIHPEIEAGLRVLSLKPGENGEVVIEEKDSNRLDEVLAEALGLDSVTLIPCAGGEIVAAAREQWNDGSNTLTIAPGVVVVYDRNVTTNKLLEDHGLQLIKVKGSELVRGRGGPRCMSMPLVREDI
ncbi:arginine deiminase [Ignavigranum ruoffiae]|uniref:Arginine deiminase n=1 Tax=Ignavigranum ruoffiae TaxID=89093 RepID=A0A1H9CV48_9LACT|nr:arginine deiminase [Ignavigranum ruoffiae]UPQ85013.1 arginine deiminase [Ignavigranum ruoffiae]SEQ04967.1 arginine deiminase [Ignavigranum ruoffiae]